MIVFGAAVLLTASGAPLLTQGPETPVTPQPAQGSHISRYLIVSGDSSSGSWDSADDARLKRWRARYGSEFVWFRQDGRDYIVTDQDTLAEFQRAMAPQHAVNRQQNDVNRHQQDVNGQQARVNSHQQEVNRAQAEVNRQQSQVNAGAADQNRVNRLQSGVNGKQQVVNAEQEKVNRQQEVVNREQDVVNRAQSRASVEIDRALQQVFDSARRQGLAREAR
ncbi:MAG TPA: hypothetical protein VKR61_06670 [Bryobacteraceae bacterium]|nr:hypothetical protein [Bryobacteraceae bacterium]